MTRCPLTAALSWLDASRAVTSDYPPELRMFIQRHIERHRERAAFHCAAGNTGTMMRNSNGIKGIGEYCKRINALAATAALNFRG